MPVQPLIVNSLTEASLYLMLERCGACAGRVAPASARAATNAEHVLTVPVGCLECGRERLVRFDLSRLDPAEAAVGLEGWAALAQAGQAPPINSTVRISRVIDVAGWLALHRILSTTARTKMEQAASAAERIAARQMQIQAGDCLEEALKFYDVDNDLPPADAFFTEEGRSQFREHPELFLRGRIASMRATSVIDKR